jgi:hypothetical protein
MTKKLSIDLKLCCPRKNCPYRNDSKNRIIKDGCYTTKNDPERRQMLYCCGGKHRYSGGVSTLWIYDLTILRNPIYDKVLLTSRKITSTELKHFLLVLMWIHVSG